MARKPFPIRSLQELFQAVPKIFEAVNADPALALRFVANPLFLAEELGYELTDEMKQFAGRRVRFSSAKTYERLVHLEKQVWELAGEPFGRVFQQFTMPGAQETGCAVKLGIEGSQRAKKGATHELRQPFSDLLFSGVEAIAPGQGGQPWS